MKTFAEYAEAALLTDRKSRGALFRMLNGALGLAGESGEFVELVKKRVIHKVPLDPEKAKKELGDVLWYLNLSAVAIGSSLEEIAAMNIVKLKKRYPGGVVTTAGVIAKADEK